MFRYLKTKLMVAYGGLLAIIFVVTALAIYGAVNQTARAKVESELEATSAVYEELWDLHETQLQQNAAIAAKDFGFREAVATSDVPTIASALANLRDRLKLAHVFVIFPDGTRIDADHETLTSAEPGLYKALQGDSYVSGILEISEGQYQSVSAPIMAPRLAGWVVFASKIDASLLRELAALSSIPLSAEIVSGEPDKLSENKSILTAQTKLEGIGSTSDSVLVLSYPVARAMAPYYRMMTVVGSIGIIGFLIVLGSNWYISNTVTNPITLLDDATRNLAAGETVELDIRSGDEIGRLARNFELMVDRVAEREKHILNMSLTDNETGLPNRRALKNFLDIHQQEEVYCVAIGFSRYANTVSLIGQAAANEIISAVGKRLLECACILSIGRTSSDTIGIAMKAKDEAAACKNAARILDVVNAPVVIGGELVDVHLQAGIAPRESEVNLTQIDLSNVAFRQAREARARVHVFDTKAYGDQGVALSLMSEMMTGLSDGTIYLAYQPKMNLRTQTADSVEALLRWNSPERGYIPPDRFIQYAEETGHIRPLSEWVLLRAIEDSHKFAAHGHDIKISINLSGRLLTDDDFIEWSIEKVAENPQGFCMEITETAVIDDPDCAITNIHKLIDAGIETSLDDYGAGLSSLSYLRKIPVQELKIDKSFIMSLGENADDALLVKSTIDLAHSLGKRVTAEGVETAEALAALSAMGADTAQGYFLCRPVPFADVITYLTCEREERSEQAETRSIATA